MTIRLGESGSRYLNFFKFIIKLQHFKRLNQPFKRSIWQKRSQGCNVLSPWIYLKVWNKIVSICNLVNSPTRQVVFRLIRSQNWNGSNRSVKDLCQTGLCKNPRKSASLPCPFKKKMVSCWVRLFTAGLITYLAKAERNPGKSELFSDSCRVRKWGCAPAIYPLWRRCSEGDPIRWANYLLLFLSRFSLHREKEGTSNHEGIVLGKIVFW